MFKSTDLPPPDDLLFYGMVPWYEPPYPSTPELFSTLMEANENIIHSKNINDIIKYGGIFVACCQAIHSNSI